MTAPSINPNIGPVQGPITPPAQAPLVPFELSTPQDVIGPSDAANTILDALLNSGKISIPAYTAVTSNSLDELRRTLEGSEYLQQLNNKKLNLSQLDQGQALMDVHSAIVVISQQQSDLYNAEKAQIQTYNSAVTQYNTQVQATMPAPNSDQSEVAQINSIIDQYNQGLIDDATFNAEIAPYNAYVTSRNLDLTSIVNTYNTALSHYNTQVVAINALIDQLNQEGILFGISAFPHLAPAGPPGTIMQLQDPAPLTIPVPHIPNRPGPAAIVPLPTAPQSQTALLSQVFTPQFVSSISTLTLSQRILDLVQAVQDFNRLFLKGNSIVLPNSFIESQPTIFFSDGSLGGGVGAALVGTTLGIPHLEQILSRGILAANQHDFQLGVVLPVFALAAFGLQVIATSGIQSSIPGFRLLGNSTMLSGTPSLTALSIAFAVSHTSVIRDAIRSGVIAQGVKQIIQKQLQGQVSQDEVDRASRVLTAQINLTLLQLTTSQLGASLNSPGLPGQLFGNVSNLPTSTFLEAANRPPTLTETLQDPLKQLFLKSNLSDQIAQSTSLSQNRSQEIAHEAINSASKTPSPQEEAIHNSLQNSLQSQGISSPVASQLASVVLDNAKKDSENFIALHTDLLKQDTSEELISQALQQQGIQPSQADRIGQEAALTLLQSGNFNNDREFQIILHQRLENFGIDTEIALAASERLFHTINSPSTNPTLNPLQSPQLQTLLSPDALSQTLYDQTFGLLKNHVDIKTAQHIANQAVLATVGSSAQAQEEVRDPSSLVNLMQEQVQVLQKESDSKVNDQIADNFRFFMNGSIDLVVLFQKMMNPAYTFAGVMYDRHEPTNFKKSVDVLV
jgi:hypothetical protein